MLENFRNRKCSTTTNRIWEEDTQCYVAHSSALLRYLCWMDAINLPILHSREREVTKFLQHAVFCCYCPSSSLFQWLPVELPHWSLHIIRGLTLKPLYQKPSLIVLTQRSNNNIICLWNNSVHFSLIFTLLLILLFYTVHCVFSFKWGLCHSKT